MPLPKFMSGDEIYKLMQTAAFEEEKEGEEVILLPIRWRQKFTEKRRIKGKDERISKCMEDIYKLICWIDRELAKTIIIRSKLICEYLALLEKCNDNGLDACMPSWAANEKMHGKGIFAQFRPTEYGFDVVLDGDKKGTIVAKIKNKKMTWTERCPA